MIPILTSGAVAMILSLLGTPLVIRFFSERGLGQPIREEGPSHHQSKAGTPTMGGAAIVLAAVGGWLAAHGLPDTGITPVGALVIVVFLGMAGIGFADDLIKVRARHNQGLSGAAKFAGQAVIAASLALLGPTYAGIPREISITGEWSVSLGAFVFVVWMFLLLAGTSNGANLTDGVDGLLAGTSALVFGAYTLVAFWQYRNPAAFGLATDLDPLDIAMVCAATTGACAGFLWHNAPPAKIFMGDTGSLALGGLLAAVAVATGTQLLLVLVGGLFVAETLSVIVQKTVFKLTKKAAAEGRREQPKRVFRMAPLHHHFELVGWVDSTIIVRFWIAAGIGVVAGLGLFYGESLERVVEAIRTGATL
ncbi:MAG: phospho-N-acetylmuramoyl-pentapeptide-transferase [Nitriliruptoraceae bacterium]